MEKLSCPKCGKKEKAKNQGISRFNHDKTGALMAKCYNPDCGHSWCLDEKSKWTPELIDSIEMFCKSRGIPTKGIQHASVSIGKWTTKNGTPSKLYGLHFKYNETLTHIISTTKSKDGNYIQLWTPKGGRKNDNSLWTYSNPEIEPVDPETLYICEGEKDGLVLGQHGFTFAALPGANGFKSGCVDWIKTTFPNIQRIRLCFDCDDPGYAGMLHTLKRLGGL